MDSKVGLKSLMQNFAICKSLFAVPILGTGYAIIEKFTNLQSKNYCNYLTFSELKKKCPLVSISVNNFYLINCFENLRDWK